MREVSPPHATMPVETATFLACLATILEVSFDELPRPTGGQDPAADWTLSRWLGGLGLGLVPVADPGSFSWPGPWIARVRVRGSTDSRFVVMYGVPSGVVWDPGGEGVVEEKEVEEGFLVAAADIALARPPRPSAPTGKGTLEAICVAPAASEPVRTLGSVRAIAGYGLEGDRHVSGKGTFPSGPPGSALTIIAAEVCESFDPPLTPNEHRRNLVTRGIDLNGLVGLDFSVGMVPCRGMRLCEPCTVVQRYAARPILRALVHRGGIRADILEDGLIQLGDQVTAEADAAAEPGGDVPAESPQR
jgi:MOSC domain-containing protein YiiM